MRQNVSNDNFSESVAIVPPIEKVFDSTANDSNKSWVVPANEMWKINFAHVMLVTSATVGNRRMEFAIKDEDGNELFDIVAGAVQAASTTRHYGYMQGIYRETVFIAEEIHIPFPHDSYLGPGYTLQIFESAAIDPTGDDMTVSFQYMKFNV